MTAASVSQLHADLGALQDQAHRAGMALACCYSSADEFEAEIIRIRRAAGAYGQVRGRAVRFVLAVTAGMSVVLLMLLWAL